MNSAFWKLQRLCLGIVNILYARLWYFLLENVGLCNVYWILELITLLEIQLRDNYIIILCIILNLRIIEIVLVWILFFKIYWFLYSRLRNHFFYFLLNSFSYNRSSAARVFEWTHDKYRICIFKFVLVNWMITAIFFLLLNKTNII